MADSGLTFSQRSAALREAQQNIEATKAEFAARYFEKGDTTGLEGVVADVEWINYLRSTTAVVATADVFKKNAYEPFMLKVEQGLGARLQRKDAQREKDTEEFKTLTVSRLADLKLSMFEELGEKIAYERDYNSIADPILNKNLQCRSGTKLFLLAALRSVKPLLQPGEKLLQIHTKGHVLPGVQLANGAVIGFEMTKSGRGITEFGTIEGIKQSRLEVKVLDAEHALAQDALGRKAFAEKTVLADTSKPSSSSGGTALGGKIANTDQYGFGSANVPAGRQPIDRADYISAQSVAGRGGIYEQMGVGKIEEDLLSKLAPQERTVMRRYMQHTNAMASFFERHVGILEEIERNPGMSIADAKDILRRAETVSNEALNYITNNDLINDHHAADKILKAHDLTLTFDVRSVLKQMMSNFDAATNIWARGQTKEGR